MYKLDLFQKIQILQWSIALPILDIAQSLHASDQILPSDEKFANIPNESEDQILSSSSSSSLSVGEFPVVPDLGALMPTDSSSSNTQLAGFSSIPGQVPGDDDRGDPSNLLNQDSPIAVQFVPQPEPTDCPDLLGASAMSTPQQTRGPGFSGLNPNQNVKNPSLPLLVRPSSRERSRTFTPQPKTPSLQSPHKQSFDPALDDTEGSLLVSAISSRYRATADESVKTPKDRTRVVDSKGLRRPSLTQSTLPRLIPGGAPAEVSRRNAPPRDSQAFHCPPLSAKAPPLRPSPDATESLEAFPSFDPRRVHKPDAQSVDGARRRVRTISLAKKKKQVSRATFNHSESEPDEYSLSSEFYDRPTASKSTSPRKFLEKHRGKLRHESESDEYGFSSDFSDRPTTSRSTQSRKSLKKHRGKPHQELKQSKEQREDLRRERILSAEEALDPDRSETFEWMNTTPLSCGEIIEITNGSLFSFGGEGSVSQMIVNNTREENPLSLSHVGIALVGTPREMITMVRQIYAWGTISHKTDRKVEQSAMHMLRQLSRLSASLPDVFCVHSTGDWGVHIDLLSSLLDEYQGQVFVRPLEDPIPLSVMYPALINHLGKRYNFHPADFLRCVNDKNKKTNNTTEFCSQFVTAVYQHCRLIPDGRDGINPKNVSPAEFGSHCETDLLREYARREIQIKYRPSNSGGGNCCNVY
jgi:hypothetical protein